MFDIAVHWALELGGSGIWACLRGRCRHRHHRVIMDMAITLVLSYAMVRMIG